MIRELKAVPMLNRRTLLTGILGVIAAPAIVRASSLMPVKAWRPSITFAQWAEIIEREMDLIADPPLMIWNEALSAVVVQFHGGGAK